MKSEKLLLFDFSGTLAFFKEPDMKEFFDFLKEIGINLKGEKEMRIFVDIFKKMLGYAKDWYEFSLKLFGQFVKNPSQGVIEKLACFLEKNIVFQLYDDAKDIFKLKNEKAILTGNSRFLVERSDVLKDMQIFTPKDTVYVKPDKKAFLFVLNKLKKNPCDVVMIGDEIKRDIIPAQKLGIRAILIDRENVYNNKGIERIDSLSQLANMGL